MTMLAPLVLALAVAAQSGTPPVTLDDPASSFCVATGFCRKSPSDGPPPGVLFVAIGLVAVGVRTLRHNGRRR